MVAAGNFGIFFRGGYFFLPVAPGGRSAVGHLAWRLAAGGWPRLAWISVVRYVERQIGGIWPLELWARPLEDIGAAVSPRCNYCGAAGNVESDVRHGRRS
ncbi:hypothetical protein NDU88_004133 [Pleurodeles waltl]|uniref:Uncharacterized protein n=1 Tax=Pleurodeles waltl TaxID=8319 RepID=A0AAV7QB02_PLEWA|nr:hypothetical protein NDU88_004133 [Pleurodeles waltl]